MIQTGLTYKLFTYNLTVIVVDRSQDLHLLELLNINSMNQNIWLGCSWLKIKREGKKKKIIHDALVFPNRILPAQSSMPAYFAMQSIYLNNLTVAE